MGASSDPPCYLLQTYIVTSNPKRISVAWGLVHIIVSFIFVRRYKAQMRAYAGHPWLLEEGGLISNRIGK